MKFSTLLVVAFGAIAMAKGDKGDKNSTQPATPGKALDKSCNEISRFTREIALANNQTKLNELMQKANLTQADVTKIKDKAANATTKLNTLKSNSTLTGMCAQAEPVTKACGQLKSVTKLAKLATNQTKLDEIMTKKNLTAEQVSKLKDKATKAGTKMQMLMGNKTLVSMCDAFKADEKTEDGKTMAAIKALSNMTNTQKASSSSSGAADLSAPWGILSTALVVGVGMIFMA